LKRKIQTDRADDKPDPKANRFEHRALF
jgi:hypothetical protein